MLKDNNLVRVFSSCETMGIVTTVCSDKTRTLRQNKMTVISGTIGLSVSFDRDVKARLKETAKYPRQTTDVDLLDKPISLQSLKSKLSQDILQLLNESIAINSAGTKN